MSHRPTWCRRFGRPWRPAPFRTDLRSSLGKVAHELQGAPGDSLRVAVVARLAGQVVAQFHLDLSRGDALIGEPDVLEGSDLLSFADIPPVRFPVYPVAQHLAEKLHAYTVPRDQVNTRAKDLVDMVAIAAVDRADADALAAPLVYVALTVSRPNYRTRRLLGNRHSHASRTTRRPHRRPVSKKAIALDLLWAPRGCPASVLALAMTTTDPANSRSR